jgi:homoserine kinase type II
VDRSAFEIVRAALAPYDLPPPLQFEPLGGQGLHNLNLRISTGAGTLRCKVFGDAHPPAALRYEQRMLQALARTNRSFALPAPLAYRPGETLQPTPLGWLACIPDLPGANLDPADLAQVESLGAALGELHAALAALPASPRPGHALFQAFFGFPPPARDPLALTPAQVGAHDTAENRALLAWWRAAAARLAAFAEGAYRRLPQQLCHNDPAPYNVLTAGGRVTALIDFEFACPAPRGLDVAMALRMTMRTWQQPDPWASAMAFCRGYGRVASLSPAEAAELPRLLELRAAMGILWALGRGAPVETERLLAHLGYLRNTMSWVERNGGRLADLAARHLTAEEAGK